MANKQRVWFESGTILTAESLNQAFDDLWRTVEKKLERFYQVRIIDKKKGVKKHDK